MKLSKKKHKYFWRLFLVPSCIWLLLSLPLMMPEVSGQDPLKWSEWLDINIIFWIFWFFVSFVVTIVINKIKDRKHKFLGENEQKIRNEKIKKDELSGIRFFMKGLSVLTIICLIGAIYVATWLDTKYRTGMYSSFMYMWTSWLWLPIPIISIILGYRYRKKGVDCFNNIVIGYIVTGALIAYGCASVFAF